MRKRAAARTVDVTIPGDGIDMSPRHRPVRVLQSFPYKIGAARICTTAWHQAAGVAAAGADVLVMPSVVHKPLPAGVRVRTTLARGRVRIPYRVLGHSRALALHDRIVARALRRIADGIDIVHVWPMAALETIGVARRLGIPTVLERPSAHTRFAFATVQRECERLGVSLPADHEHAFNADTLRREEREFALADRLLCPSDFVVRSFLDEGFASERLARHIYGYDDATYHPPAQPRVRGEGLRVLFVGVCAVRKGLHFALDAWLRSPASRTGRFLVAGEFLPVVCGEALASGCVPLVSDAASAACRDRDNALVHAVGDVDALSAHFSELDADRDLLDRLADRGLGTAPEFTWTAAGTRLVEVYEEVVARHAGPRRVAA